MSYMAGVFLVGNNQNVMLCKNCINVNVKIISVDRSSSNDVISPSDINEFNIKLHQKTITI